MNSMEKYLRKLANKRTDPHGGVQMERGKPQRGNQTSKVESLLISENTVFSKRLFHG